MPPGQSAETMKSTSRGSKSKKRSGKSADVKPARARRKPSRLRKWVTRLLAIVLAPAIFLLLLEGGLRLLGYGHATAFLIPGPEGTSYISNPRFGWRFFGKALSREPLPIVLSREKPADTYRIFVFGGSAAQGVPNPTFGFARLLDVMLNDRYAGRRFEVINAGMTGINSHVVLTMARDAADFQPDLYVVYLGNNEVVGPHGAAAVFQGYTPSRRIVRASIWFRGTRVGQLLGRTLGAFSRKKKRKLWGGMDMFSESRVRADAPVLTSVYDNYRDNLLDICAVARDAGARVILSTVAVNLKDCPPFASVHREGLPDADKKRWEALREEGMALAAAGKHPEAVEKCLAAAKIDDRFAELDYQLAGSYLSLKDFEKARRHFIRARDLDALRFRTDTRINRIIREVAESLRGQGVHFVDGVTAVAPGTDGPRGVPGAETLYEHAHLNFAGNYAMAAALFRTISELLPADVRGTPRPVSPPSLSKSVELASYTDCDRYASAAAMAALMEKPAFSREQYAEMVALRDRLQARITPKTVADAAGQYARALRRRPDDLLLAETYAKLHFDTGQNEAAGRQLRAMLERYPDFADWRYNLGRILARQGKFEQAVVEYERALAIRPSDPFACMAAGEALERLGKTGRAVEYYRRAIDLTPKMVAGLTSLAWIYASDPDASLRNGAEAVAMATRAIEAGGETPPALDALAAAQAEQGRFPEAIRTAEKARTLAVRAARPDVARQIAMRLKLYRADKPYRSPRPK